MEEKTILINNSKINYKIAGSGPAILVLHGWGGSSSSWDKVQKILASKGYTVICPDLPGFGESDIPREAWDVSDYMDLVVKFVKSQELESFFVLGHSFGGRVAIKLAVRHPEKIKALILCGSAGIKPKLSLKTKIILKLTKIGKKIFSPKSWIKKVFYFFLRNKDYVKAKGTMKETMKKVLAEDLLPYLSEIRTRTLIVWGEKDKMVPVEKAHIFKEKIAGSILEILPQAGHSPHLKSPEKLSEIIFNFFK